MLDETRVLVVYPGALYSTIDVAHGLHKALQKRVKTFSFQYDKYLIYHKAAQQYVSGTSFNPETVIDSAAKNVLLRILECRPDWVLFISGIAFPTKVWEYVKQLQSDLKHEFHTAVLLTESPYVEEWEIGIIERVDIVFTTDYSIIDEYKVYNPRIYYIGHAYDPEIHYPRPGQPKSHDVFMVATGFPERQRLLERVNWDDINLSLYGNWMYMKPESPIHKFLRGANLDNSNVAEHYRNSKIALNIFRTVKWPDENPKFIEASKAKAISPRCYEVMACGSMLLTDWREELESQFGNDTYVLWGNASELEEKTRWYLAHDSERDRVINAGLQAVKPYTFDLRADEILKRMGEY